MREKLKGRDYEVLVDRSGSMATMMNNGKTRFAHCAELALGIAHVAAGFDPDGITVGTFPGKVLENQTPDKVEQIFKEWSPMGGTPTDEVLQARFDAYLSRKAAGNAKPLSIIIFTDGQPNEPQKVIDTIVNFTKKIDANGEEVAVTFCQIGNADGVAEFLRDLDDNLVSKYGAACDIVDCKNEEEINNLANAEELLLAGIED